MILPFDRGRAATPADTSLDLDAPAVEAPDEPVAGFSQGKRYAVLFRCAGAEDSIVGEWATREDAIWYAQEHCPPGFAASVWSTTGKRDWSKILPHLRLAYPAA